ncbi:MAG: phage tail tube protein [Spirochaetes bacterium]|nr:phage tail tube protein [Spirochaetota bacterium]
MGVGCQVAIGKEAVWGDGAADTLLVNFTSESLAPTVTKQEEENLLAGKAASAYDLMGIKVAGDISGILKPELAGFLLKAALGGDDTVDDDYGSVTGQMQHTIVAQEPDEAMPSYAIRVDRKVAIKLYAGCKIDSLKISAKAGDYVRFVSAVKGMSEAVGTITTTTPPSKKAYKFIGGTCTADEALEITSVELDYQNSLDEGIQTNVSGLYATEPNHGKRKIGISIEMPYNDESEDLRETNFLTETVIETIILHLESPEYIVGTSKYRMDITLNNVAILEAKDNVSGAGLLTMSIKGEATAVSTTEPISAVIYDDQEAPY